MPPRCPPPRAHRAGGVAHSDIAPDAQGVRLLAWTVSVHGREGHARLADGVCLEDSSEARSPLLSATHGYRRHGRNAHAFDILLGIVLFCALEGIHQLPREQKARHRKAEANNWPRVCRGG